MAFMEIRADTPHPWIFVLSFHQHVRELAKKEGISMSQLIASELGKKIAVLVTKGHLEERAERGSIDKL